MKKFILSLAAVCAMVLTAVSFASCSEDDDNAVNYVNVKADFAVNMTDDVTDAQKAQVTSILGVLNGQVELLEGESFKIAAVKTGSSYAPTSAAAQKVEKDVLDDDVVKTCVSQLKGTKAVKTISFEIKDAKTSDTYYTNTVE